MQTGNTRTMVFGVAKIISYLSEFMTLLPGDVLMLCVEGLGKQRQLVVPFVR